MAKRKRETSGGADGHKFDFFKNDPESAEIMADPKYHKMSMFDNIPLMAALWVKSYPRFGPGAILIDFISMSADDVVGKDQVQFPVTYMPKDEALKACDNHPGLRKMFFENIPDLFMIAIVMHPKGQSFYHLKSNIEGLTLQDLADTVGTQLGEFEIPKAMLDRIIEKQKIIRDEAEENES